eukprot:2740366-Pyramimonas_sp.AAC.1
MAHVIADALGCEFAPLRGRSGDRYERSHGQSQLQALLPGEAAQGGDPLRDDAARRVRFPHAGDGVVQALDGLDLVAGTRLPP